MTRERLLLAVFVSLLVSQRGLADQCADNKSKFISFVDDLSKKDIDAARAQSLIRLASDNATDKAGTICAQAAQELIRRIKDNRRPGLPHYVSILGEIQNLGAHEDNVVKALCPLLRDPTDKDIRTKSAMALVRKYASPKNKDTAITKLGAAKVAEADPVMRKAFQEAIKSIRQANSSNTAITVAIIGAIGLIISTIIHALIVRVGRGKDSGPRTGTSLVAWFSRASAREERLLAFMHRDVNHSLRDLVWMVDQSENNRGTTNKRVRPVKELTNDFLRTLLERVSDEAEELAGHKCCVSLHVPVKCGPLIEELDSRGKSPEDREMYAEKMGGEGSECESTSENRDRIVVWARERSRNREGLRDQTSCKYWFLYKSTAHAYFEGHRNRAVYCPAYDLETLSTEAGCGAVTDHGDSVFHFPKRPKFWLNYRSVAVFPIRGRPLLDSTEPSIVGYLWIDSKEPRAFKNLWEDPGPPEEWGAPMHFIQAITDALAIALSNETFTKRRQKQQGPIVPAGQGPTAERGQGPTVPLGLGPTVQPGQGPTAARGQGPTVPLGLGPTVQPGQGPTAARGQGPTAPPGQRSIKTDDQDKHLQE